MGCLCSKDQSPTFPNRLGHVEIIPFAGTRIVPPQAITSSAEQPEQVRDDKRIDRYENDPGPEPTVKEDRDSGSESSPIREAACFTELSTCLKEIENHVDYVFSDFEKSLEEKNPNVFFYHYKNLQEDLERLNKLDLKKINMIKAEKRRVLKKIIFDLERVERRINSEGQAKIEEVKNSSSEPEKQMSDVEFFEEDNGEVEPSYTNQIEPEGQDKEPDKQVEVIEMVTLGTNLLENGNLEEQFEKCKANPTEMLEDVTLEDFESLEYLCGITNGDIDESLREIESVEAVEPEEKGSSVIEETSRRSVIEMAELFEAKFLKDQIKIMAPKEMVEAKLDVNYENAEEDSPPKREIKEEESLHKTNIAVPVQTRRFSGSHLPSRIAIAKGETNILEKGFLVHSKSEKDLRGLPPKPITRPKIPRANSRSMIPRSKSNAKEKFDNLFI